jgi:ribosomal protein L21
VGTREARTRATETETRRDRGRARDAPRLARRIASRPRACPSRARVAPPRFADAWLFSRSPGEKASYPVRRWVTTREIDRSFFFSAQRASADAPADLRLPFAFPSNAAAVETSVNQIGFTTPPSTGAAPSWDAIVEVGGSQQFVSEGRYYECHSLKGVEPGAKIAFERVLATLDGDEPTFGMPYVKGARVEATVLENFKDKKLIVFKYRRKKHYKRKNGHRQPMTRFLVTKVVKP